MRIEVLYDQCMFEKMTGLFELEKTDSIETLKEKVHSAFWNAVDVVCPALNKPEDITIVCDATEEEVTDTASLHWHLKKNRCNFTAKGYRMQPLSEISTRC
ncbi:MAG: hypothetical protein MRY21_07605 [Simkaniaceae bacterium]|nr:hypothetical protein [Simkaniaceae bacterium]